MKEKHQLIWQKAQKLLAQGRMYDLWHTDIAIAHMLEILSGEHKEDLTDILLPAIILHDIGWSQLGEEKNTKWDNHDLRIAHMQAGAELAQQILIELSYPSELILPIIHLVATHDNEYLGIAAQTDQEKLLRDADACFILTELSFWKDYAIKGAGISPQDFLAQQVKKYARRYSLTAQRITDQQVIDRTQEIGMTDVSPQQRFEQLKAIAIQKNQAALRA